MRRQPFRIATRLVLTLGLVAGCAASDGGPASPPSAATSPGSGCPAGLVDAMAAWAEVGFSGVITVQHSDVQCTRAVGLRDREASTPMSDDTVFAIGSVSKSVTAAAILRLVADGRLALGTAAGDVVTGLVPPIADVTIEQLLTHTSGIVGDAGPDHQPLSRDEAIASINALPQIFDPGTDFGYANAGYTLLALVIDTITGDYRDFVVDTILPVAGRPTSAGFWDGEPAARGPRAVGYLDTGRSEVLGQFEGPHWSTSGNGDVAMTVPDLASWALNLFDGGLLPPAQTAELMSPKWDQGDGLSETVGWVRFDASVFGAEGFGSAGGGGDTGHNAIIAVVPSRDTAIAIASNGPDVDAEQLMQQLIPALLAGDAVPLPAPSSDGTDPAALDAAVGTYTFPDGSTLEVSNDDGRLLVAAIGPTAIDSIFTLPDPFTRADVDAHEAAVVELLTGDAPIGADEREGVRDAVGDIVDVAVHGTMADGNELHTYVRVTGSRSSLELWYALDENGGVAAAEGPTVPPTATFTGGSDGEFVSADPMRRRADVTLRFEAGTVIVDTGATTSTARQDI